MHKVVKPHTRMRIGYMLISHDRLEWSFLTERQALFELQFLRSDFAFLLLLSWLIVEEKNEIPSFYKRYVDDTYTVMPDFKKSNDFLDKLNSCHENLNFTMEIAEQSKKISQVLAPKEKKPPIVNDQCVVYNFNVIWHLHQRTGEHKHSAIGRHFEDHGLNFGDVG